MSRAMVRHVVAAIVTELLSPAPLTALAIAVVAWHSAPTPAQALGWTVLGCAFAPLLPLLHLVRQVRAGLVTDHHVPVREQRPRMLAIALGSFLAGLALLLTLQAPRPLIALLIAGATAVAAALAITLRWKISVHVAASAGILTVCTLLFGPAVLLLLPLVPLVAWSRVELGVHTPAQVIAGAALGATISGSAFVLASRLL
jgi:membrane-associated phospholipid phosphatase